MARDEVFLREWGSAGNGDGQFNVVISVAVHGDEVYVTDFRNQRVQVFDRRGDYLRQWGQAGAGDGEFAAPNGPAGLAVHEDEVYVTDLGNNRVQVFNRHGTFLRKWGSAGDEDLQFNTLVVLPCTHRTYT